MRSVRGLGQSHPRREDATRNLVDSHRIHGGALYLQANGRNGARWELQISQQQVGLQAQSLRQAVYQRAIGEDPVHSPDARIS